MMHQGAAPILFARARQFRENPTKAEQHLWEQLSNKKLGVKFRRQHPLHLFIVDFYCHELKLVIEVDGGIHLVPENASYDQMRSELINDFGIKVIRFRNEEVLLQTEKVLAVIREVIAESGVNL